MKNRTATRFALFTAAIALSGAAGLAQAQNVSNDDFSSLVGPNAPQMAHGAQSLRGNTASAPVQRTAATPTIDPYQQGLVGPTAARPAGELTRAQVMAEMEQARAEGKLVPGYEYLAAGGAPTGAPAPTSNYAGTAPTPAGQ